MTRKKKKIIKYKKPLNINIGMVIFMCIFIYMVFSVYAYITRENIQFYEVLEGSIVKNRVYTGIILRDEEVEYTEQAGHINYFVREGKKVAVGSSVYSIDETGTLTQMMSENMQDGSLLKPEQIQQLRSQLSGFSRSFDPMNFHTVYYLKQSLETTVLDQMDDQLLGQIEMLMRQSGNNFQQIRAKKSGVVSYVIDHYETMKPEEIQKSDFEQVHIAANIVRSGAIIEKNVPVFKYILSDKWSVVFPLSEADAAEFAGQEMLQIKFLGKGYDTQAVYSVITGKDGASYGKLDFDKYMLEFLSGRQVSFEIDANGSNGLKIPITSVTNKEFYLVPADYLTMGGNSSEAGFLKDQYSEQESNGTFIPTALYYSNDEYYYIDAGEQSELKAGDYIIKPESTERYQIGMSASLQGVYNINKGYTAFKQIEIIDQNDEYYTVKKNTKYGLAVYDHIVLDASVIEKEGTFIYR